MKPKVDERKKNIIKIGCKKIITIFLLVCITSSFAQVNKLKIQSVDFGIGGFSIKNNYSEGGGATFLGNLTTSYKNNLIGFSFLTGAEIGIIGKSNYSFNELSILYGREFKLIKWFAFETFAGIGYYNQSSESHFIFNGDSTSFPFKINSKFYLNKNFGLGLGTNYSINKINNNFSVNLICHYKFN
jgi:hypothetical protein